jgi:hypothetical protein
LLAFLLSYLNNSQTLESHLTAITSATELIVTSIESAGEPNLPNLGQYLREINEVYWRKYEIGLFKTVFFSFFSYAFLKRFFPQSL